MEQINTQNLTLTLASLRDLPALEEIERECDEYFTFDPPYAGEHNRTIRDCMAIGDMIPGVSDEDYRRENYYLYCVWQENTLIGWLSYYLEYQQKDTVYLSVLYIKEAYRKNGVGAEILETLTRKLAAEHFKIIRLHCSLRNATALRFFVKNGFDRIAEVACNGNLYPENFGGVELMKILGEA